MQGGPGAALLFPLFAINGPIRPVFNSSGGITCEWYPHSWSKTASILYVDNPIGSGFSHSMFEGLPSNQIEATEGLYELLVQFFTLFPQYRSNDFHVFGESYAGDLNIYKCKGWFTHSHNHAISMQPLGIGHATLYLL